MYSTCPSLFFVVADIVLIFVYYQVTQRQHVQHVEETLCALWTAAQDGS